MTDALIQHESLTARQSGGALHDWMRLHAWSVRRRRAVAAAIAAISALSAGAVCVEADMAGVRAARTQLDDAGRRLAAAQRAVDRLPSLRRAASGVSQGVRESTAADDVRRMSELTSTSGLALVTLEPSAQGGAGAETFRPMKFVAQGGFAQLRTFLGGLATQPGLVVPADLSIRRNGDGLSIAATLQVFDGLPPIQPDAPDSARDGAASDPAFDPASDPFASSAADGALRLVGVLHGGAGIVALVESASGTEAVRAGQMVAGARVERVLPSRVVLASGGKSRILTWAGEGAP